MRHEVPLFRHDLPLFFLNSFAVSANLCVYQVVVVLSRFVVLGWVPFGEGGYDVQTCLVNECKMNR